MFEARGDPRVMIRFPRRGYGNRLPAIPLHVTCMPRAAPTATGRYVNPAAECSVTGPSSPDFPRGASSGHTLMMPKVSRPAGPGLSSSSLGVLGDILLQASDCIVKPFMVIYLNRIRDFFG